jgi:hypothetical protein
VQVQLSKLRCLSRGAEVIARTIQSSSGFCQISSTQFFEGLTQISKARRFIGGLFYFSGNQPLFNSHEDDLSRRRIP